MSKKKSKKKSKSTKKKSTKKKSAKKVESNGNGRQPDFNMEAAAKADRREPREGCKRARVLQMLRRKSGATLEQVMEEIGWERRTAYEGVRLINLHCGIGLSQDDNGRIRADAAA